jgi:hypothetical protein
MQKSTQLAVPVCALLSLASVLAKANEQLAEELAATRARYEAVGAVLHGLHCFSCLWRQTSFQSPQLLSPLPINCNPLFRR